MAEPANDPRGDYIQINAVDWAPFPEGLCDGPIHGNTIALVGAQQVLDAWTASA